MKEEQNVQPGEQRKSISRDIAPVLHGWKYEPGAINVRKIHGIDGQPKLQMRLDLGLLQMEMAGRPDGSRPYGAESVLDHLEQQLGEHRKRVGTDRGFNLTSEQCQELRDEAVLYYHRYVSLFVLDEFKSVVRDTARNLRVLDFCARYASDRQDRLVLEQYRPYIVMMNAKATASMQVTEKNYAAAMVTVKRALATIKAFFHRFEQDEAYTRSNEVKVLRRFAREIRKHLPVDPVRKLQSQLNRAVQEERYEDAARFRDELARLSAAPTAES